MEKLTCADAKQLDLVDYLASLNHLPQKVRNQDYWYLSPLREEKTPSFKVNRALNVWYDHGTGKGGDLVDFGTYYYNCTVSELLHRLSEYQPGQPLSFQQPYFSSTSSPTQVPFAGEKKDSPDSKIVILNVRPRWIKPYWTTWKKGVSPRRLPNGPAGRSISSFMENNIPSSDFPTEPEGMSCEANISKVAARPKTYPLSTTAPNRLPSLKASLTTYLSRPSTKINRPP